MKSDHRDNQTRLINKKVKPTVHSDNQYFHKVVDCQWACPAHIPVPEYIRHIAAGRYDDALSAINANLR